MGSTFFSNRINQNLIESAKLRMQDDTVCLPFLGCGVPDSLVTDDTHESSTIAGITKVVLNLHDGQKNTLCQGKTYSIGIDRYLCDLSAVG